MKQSINGGKQADVSRDVEIFIFQICEKYIFDFSTAWAITQNVQYVIWVLANAFTNYLLVNVHYVHYN